MIEPLVLALMVWIAARTDLPIPDPPSYAIQTSLAPTTSTVRGVHLPALYDEASGSVLLPRDWRPDDAVDQSILLHDLVHYMQAKSHASYRCHAAREAQAYDLQIGWLKERGIDFFEAFDLDARFVARLHRCPGDIDTARD